MTEWTTKFVCNLLTDCTTTQIIRCQHPYGLPSSDQERFFPAIGRVGLFKSHHPNIYKKKQDTYGVLSRRFFLFCFMEMWMRALFAFLPMGQK